MKTPKHGRNKLVWDPIGTNASLKKTNVYLKQYTKIYNNKLKYN